MLWSGRRLTGRYWYSSLTGRHQTNVAGSKYCLQHYSQGWQCPYLQCPHLHVQESWPGADLCQGITNDWERIYPAHVLSQEQPKPCAEWKLLQVFATTPSQAPTAGSRSVLSPGFAGSVGWAAIQSDSCWLQRCDQVWAEKQILWRLCLLSLLIIPPSPQLSSLTPILHSHHGPYLPCMHFLLPFLNTCNLSFYYRCWPNVVEWVFCSCYQQTTIPYAFQYFFSVNASRCVMTFVFTQVVMQKTFLCLFSCASLWHKLFISPLKSKTEPLCKQTIFCNTQHTVCVPQLQFLITHFSSVNLAAAVSSQLNKKLYKIPNCILYILATYLMKLWKSKSGIQISSFPKLFA